MNGSNIAFIAQMRRYAHVSCEVLQSDSNQSKDLMFRTVAAPDWHILAPDCGIIECRRQWKGVHLKVLQLTI